MANYSVNQVHQMYVANAYNAAVSDASAVGTLGAFKKIEDALKFGFAISVPSIL